MSFGAPVTAGFRRFWDMRDPWVRDYLRDKVIGTLDYVTKIAGGNENSLQPDGSIVAELQVITGATNEVGFNCLSAR